MMLADLLWTSAASFTVILTLQLFGDRALCRDMLRVRNAARCTHVIRLLSKNANITRLDRARSSSPSCFAVQPLTDWKFTRKNDPETGRRNFVNFANFIILYFAIYRSRFVLRLLHTSNSSCEQARFVCRWLTITDVDYREPNHARGAICACKRVGWGGVARSN